MTGASRHDESVATRGARWTSAAVVIMGLLNYGYALVLTRLLDVASYATFIAGQGLILWAATLATSSVPWVLAQSMVRARSAAERGAAIRFAILASAVSGIIAATVVGIIVTRFGGLLTALVVAASTLVIFLGTATTGWLQGQQRMRTLSAILVGEIALKNAAGLLLVVVAGLRENGALAGFWIGGMVMLLWWPRIRRDSRGPWMAPLANRDLWYRTVRFALLQGLVSLFVVTDVVLVALLPGDRAVAASYQASATLSRAPVFIAGAVAVAFFPALSRHGSPKTIAARALQMYATVALPLAAVLATAPVGLLAVVFPAKYAAIATLLKFTAVAGLAAGGVDLVIAFFQAADDFSCLPWLIAGLAGYVVALLTGWRAGGVTGLAAGAALGALAALTLVGYHTVRQQGLGLLARIPVVELAVAVGVLVLLRSHPVLWLMAAVIIGLRATVRFFRPGGRATDHPDREPPLDRPVPLPLPVSPAEEADQGNGWRPARRTGSLDEQTPPPAARHVVISSFDNPGNPHYGGGGAAVVQMIAHRLAADFDVTVVTAGRRSGEVVRDGVRYRQLPVGWAGPRAGQLLFHALLPFATWRIPHDLWIESFTPPFSTSFLPLFSRSRVVGFAQNLSAEEMWARYRIPFFLVERFGLRFYRDVVVVNPADRARVLRYSPSATVRIIPNCIDLPSPDDRLLGRGAHILFLGRIDTQEKGLDLLLAAYKRSGLTMPLIVAGAGTRREERKLAALLTATGGDVRWLGHVTGERKRELLEDSAFMVLSSRYESFGLAALESMSCAKPVVHFDLPSLAWMEGDVRVPPFEVGALAAKMRNLAGDETGRREAGRAALAAAQRYGRAETADRYAALVAQLVDGSGTGVAPGRSHPGRPGVLAALARRRQVLASRFSSVTGWLQWQLLPWWHWDVPAPWQTEPPALWPWHPLQVQEPVTGPGINLAPATARQAGPSAAEQAGSTAQKRAGSRARAVALAAAVVGAVTLIVRLALHERSFDLFGDEVIYTDIGRSVINGGFPRFEGKLFFLHGPGFFYLESGWERLLGSQHSLLSWIYEMRTLNAVLAAATAVVLVMLAARAGSLWAGAAAGLLFALDPFCIRQNDRVLLETAMMLWVLLGYLVFTSLIGRPVSRGKAAVGAVGAGLLFGFAVLTKDEAGLLTLLPLLAAAALRWGPGRRLTMLTVGTTIGVYAVYLVVVAANGNFRALWVAKTSGIQRLLGLVQVSGFHSRGGGSLAARLIAEGAYFATTYLILALAVPAVLLLLRRGGQLQRMLGLLYCAAAVALGYALVLGTLEEQELYLLLVPSLLVIPVAATLLGGESAVRKNFAAMLRGVSPARKGLTVRTSRGAQFTAALLLVLGINLVTSVQWLRQPDDGVAQLLSYMRSHVPARTGVTVASGTDVIQFALASRYNAGTWVTAAALSHAHVRYVVVPWAEVNEGYAHVTASQVRRVIGPGRLMFSLRERTYGDLALYRVPLPKTRARPQSPTRKHAHNKRPQPPSSTRQVRP
jgi:glycosyltransferase involved in cell wall biosynthesis/O-antigen/teichoic acid export membrane protein